MRRIYLGCPFSHPNHSVRRMRKLYADRVAAKLMEKYAVFSPLSHSYPIAKAMDPGLMQDHNFWMKQDLPWLEQSQELHVMGLDGWDKSSGLQKEIDHFRGMMNIFPTRGLKFVFYNQNAIDAILKGEA